MGVIKFYQIPALDSTAESLRFQRVVESLPKVSALQTEFCYYVQIQNGDSLSEDDLTLLKIILSRPTDHLEISDSTHIPDKKYPVIEIGPRLNFSTAFSTNAVSMARAVGLKSVQRIERSVRYQMETNEGLNCDEENVIVNLLSDRMTETRYVEPLTSFEHGITTQRWYEVDVLKEGKSALQKVNEHLGLALDAWDVDYYYNLFAKDLKRNPTSVECFDLAQSNSEHSRHWFFKGRLVIDGKELPDSLMHLITETQQHSNDNNVIKFSDNSSAIRGFSTQFIVPSRPGEPSQLVAQRSQRHITYTAETHNFPTGVSPFSGATTGTGGRIRDNQAVGRGGHVIAGTVGYSFGQLLIPGYHLPWEDANLPYPSNLARPLQIAIEASDGASDYGNKFGEPVVCGFTRSFGLVLPDQSRREWIKPIMFSGGIGQVDEELIHKMEPEIGMKVVKIGGPAYRIGLGGGAASSLQVQGDNRSELDYGAVQRGDAEMEQKMNRLLRACIESGADVNPICSIHDQGAGGNGNVLKEIVDPLGATFYVNQFNLGDPTLSTLELWGAEYQESNAVLCKSAEIERLQKIAHRERCPVAVVGEVTGNGRVMLCESPEGPHPVDLPLNQVLEHMPPKTFKLESHTSAHLPLMLDQIDVHSALERVLRLPSVASKRYLTNKVDRSVTGLVAQQQCVGPLHTPLADVAVVALSYFENVGSAVAIGEQPIIGLVNPGAGARMSLAEALLNLVWAPISALRDVKCSCNWMWPAKLPGEGASLVAACTALCKAMAQLGVAIDGGKDSLSMAVRTDSQVVKAPGTVVISAYAPCSDIRLIVTPDFKLPCCERNGSILLVDLSCGFARLGGSALAQCYKQVGDVSPDLNDPDLLTRAFGVAQQLINEKLIVSGHDISDGGLVTCLLEMAFAGVCGFDVDIPTAPEVRQGDPLQILFAEELGMVLEVEPEHESRVLEQFNTLQVPCFKIGCTKQSGAEAQIRVCLNGKSVIDGRRSCFMKMWEETSYQLEHLQANPTCVLQEFQDVVHRKGPDYHLTYDPDVCIPREPKQIPSIAIIREEGTNGDREMAAAFMESGFLVWDINTQDLLDSSVNLDHFRGIAFPGGFSFGDVLGSAKGWAASMMCLPSIRQQLERFRNRPETFSLGVCNGCQLMALMGWIDPDSVTEESFHGLNISPAVFLDHNESGRYESRYSTVLVKESNSILLRGMSGTRTGVWVAHGEGQFTFRQPEILKKIESSGCVALRYVSDDRQPTSVYPMNPNGSANAIAGLCSADGRHLALMPHPERCVWNWQLPWKPLSWNDRKYGPWKKLFDNAYLWSTNQVD